MITPPVYTDALFRQQFPAYKSTVAYPAAALEFAWNMGANWLSQQQACWGLQGAKLQQAADLMATVILYQLYGPASGSTQTPSQDGEAPGAVSSATEGSVSASFQLPDIGNSAFASLLLSSPPYGRLLLALLQIGASVGAYIPSRRGFSQVPP